MHGKYLGFFFSSWRSVFLKLLDHPIFLRTALECQLALYRPQTISPDAVTERNGMSSLFFLKDKNGMSTVILRLVRGKTLICYRAVGDDNEQRERSACIHVACIRQCSFYKKKCCAYLCWIQLSRPTGSHCRRIISLNENKLFLRLP